MLSVTTFSTFPHGLFVSNSWNLGETASLSARASGIDHVFLALGTVVKNIESSGSTQRLHSESALMSIESEADDGSVPSLQ